MTEDFPQYHLGVCQQCRIRHEAERNKRLASLEHQIADAYEEVQVTSDPAARAEHQKRLDELAIKRRNERNGDE